MRKLFLLLLLCMTPIASAKNLSCAVVEARVSLEFVEMRTQQRRLYAVFRFTNGSVRERRFALSSTDPLEVTAPDAWLELRRKPTDAWGGLPEIGTFATPREWLVIDPTGQVTLFYRVPESLPGAPDQARLVLSDETRCKYHSDAFTVPARNT